MSNGRVAEPTTAAARNICSACSRPKTYVLRRSTSLEAEPGGSHLVARSASHAASAVSPPVTWRPYSKESEPGGRDGTATDAWLGSFLASSQGANKVNKLARAINGP